jgi:hypothetical protein
MTEQETRNKIYELEEKIADAQREYELFYKLFVKEAKPLAYAHGQGCIDTVKKAYDRKLKHLKIKLDIQRKWLNDEPKNIDFKL